MAEISAARRVAHVLLLTVDRGEAHSDDLLREDKSMGKMSAMDRHLTTALVLGVLRWQIQLDQWIRRLLAKPNAKLDAAVVVALRMGAFQLMHLDRVPAHAAIDESVELTKRSGFRSAAGLVNAVLRKIAQERIASVAGFGHDFSGAAVAAHPTWMVERWRRFFGEDRACDLCVYDQSPPPPVIRLTAPEVERELAEAGVTVGPGRLLSAARVVIAGDVAATALFREGRVRIQDEGSQLVAEIAASAIPAEAGNILDCCAAPGGKTLILAERNPSARMVACEASRARLKQLRDRLGGLGERVECRLADATALDIDSGFDMVLADVPCSGTGTLSRNPEIRHRLRAEDLSRQAERQRAILCSALRAAGVGGRIVYSTCSLEPEENEDVIGAVVAQSENVRVIPMGSTLDALSDRGVLTADGAERLRECLTAEGFVRLLPGALGTDGFFIAMMEKVSRSESECIK